MTDFLQKRTNQSKGILKDRTSYKYSDEYYTPEYIYSGLGQFDIDPCAGPISNIAKVNNRDKTGLDIPWNGRVWLNPPYSDMMPWLQRFSFCESGVALLNAKTDTKWFHFLVQYCSGVFFIKKRVRFKGSTKSGNTSGSALFLKSEYDVVMMNDKMNTKTIEGTLMDNPFKLIWV
jgi:DNA N-6-adenine-methyltransferase (Dam)